MHKSVVSILPTELLPDYDDCYFERTPDYGKFSLHLGALFNNSKSLSV